VTRQTLVLVADWEYLLAEYPYMPEERETARADAYAILAHGHPQLKVKVKDYPALRELHKECRLVLRNHKDI